MTEFDTRNETAPSVLESRLASHHFDNITYVEEVQCNAYNVPVLLHCFI